MPSQEEARDLLNQILQVAESVLSVTQNRLIIEGLSKNHRSTLLTLKDPAENLAELARNSDSTKLNLIPASIKVLEKQLIILTSQQALLTKALQTLLIHATDISKLIGTLDKCHKTLDAVPRNPKSVKDMHASKAKLIDAILNGSSDALNELRKALQEADEDSYEEITYSVGNAKLQKANIDIQKLYTNLSKPDIKRLKISLGEATLEENTELVKDLLADPIKFTNSLEKVEHSTQDSKLSIR